MHAVSTTPKILYTSSSVIITVILQCDDPHLTNEVSKAQREEMCSYTERTQEKKEAEQISVLVHYFLEGDKKENNDESKELLIQKSELIPSEISMI